tara:strand:+ start:379 stop:696 length:318 start_codon:yes stop_codon:yes gene_type:complete
MTTTTLGFGMFTFNGDKAVESLAKYFRNLRVKGSLPSEESIITALENLKTGDTARFGEATDTTVRDSVLNYVDDGVRIVTFADGDVRNYPPTLTPGDYDYLKGGE